MEPKVSSRVRLFVTGKTLVATQQKRILTRATIAFSDKYLDFYYLQTLFIIQIAQKFIHACT